MSAVQSVCIVHKLGCIHYLQARERQEQLAGAIAAGKHPPTLLLLQHPHTFTFGRRGQEQNLLWSPEELQQRGVEIHWIDRGGDVTYHGPGQLVGYPLIPLGAVSQSGYLPQADYVGYLRRLEQSLIHALATLGIACAQIPELTGVWVQPDVASRCPRCPPAARKSPSKIASIGVKVDARGISRHGFALNVDPDMSYWEGIVACGLADSPSISLADLLDPVPSMEDVQQAVISAFGSTFGFTMEVQDIQAPPCGAPHNITT